MYTMKESVAVAKEADAKKGVSPTKTDNRIQRLRDEPERQIGSLRDVIGNIRRDGGKPSVDSIAAELSSMSSAQRAPALLALQQTHGNRYVQRVVAGIQAKLVVGQPGDIYEQEADRVADEVMRMPEPQVQWRAEEEVKGEEILQAIRGGGQALPESVQAYFELRFGYDFSRVRVHTDARAADSARAVNARAYTVGRDVVFATGQYAPETTSGKKLLAHELTHVVQQRAKPGTSLHLIQRFEPWFGTRPPAEPAEPRLEDLGEAANEFDDNHGDLEERERLKIHSALRNVLISYDPQRRAWGRNLHLLIAYYNYYSRHEIIKDPDLSIPARTAPNGDTNIRPNLLEPRYSNFTLGGILIHEFTHTRHIGITFAMYQEGEAYGIEYFFAERTNNIERKDRIQEYLADPRQVRVDVQFHPAFRRLFHISYATLVGLYEVIDRNQSTLPNSPFTDPSPLTRNHAYAMTAELISRQEDRRSERLRRIVEWVGNYLNRFHSP